MVKYAPLGVQMLIKWVGLVGFVRYLVTRCLVFQYPGGLRHGNRNKTAKYVLNRLYSAGGGL